MKRKARRGERRWLVFLFSFFSFCVFDVLTSERVKNDLPFHILKMKMNLNLFLDLELIMIWCNV